MKFLAPTSVLALAQTALAAISSHDIPRTTNVGALVPGAYIVELSQQSNQLGPRDAGSLHEQLYTGLAKRKVNWKVLKEFNSGGLFIGTAIQLSDPKDLAQVVNTPGVESIRPIRRFPKPSPQKQIVVKSPQDKDVPPDTQSNHKMIGVDKLHAQGILGKGIKIGIIDTGIDYTHPNLGAGFGPGHKVAGGFDLVGDAYTGQPGSIPVPDPDPLDQCAGHGTHVAGIIGADPGNEFNISGVAYEATLFAYRVFGCATNAVVTDDVLVDAMLRAAGDGMHVITMSIGGPEGWTESTSEVVASRLSTQGKVVTIAAGNDGLFGSWLGSSPGDAINSISVASVDNTAFPVQNAIVSGADHPPIPYESLFPIFNTSGPFPIFATSTDITMEDDACEPLPSSTPDLSGSIVLIRRGTCAFVTKIANAVAFGATKVLFYNNVEGLIAPSVGDFPATLITKEDGEFLVQQFAAKLPVMLTFPLTGVASTFPDTNGGLISAFSSYGPTYEAFFKPNVAAPGGNILSTFPVPLGSFLVDSGTSMATPATAGAAALILSVRGANKATALQMRDLLQGTAQPVGSSHTDGDPFQTLAVQGAGLINAFLAVHTTTVVSPAQLMLNDTANARDIQTFTIENQSNQRKTFKLTHVPAGTMASFQSGTIFAADGPVPLTTSAAKVSIIPSTLTLFPGQRASVIATFKRPPSDDNTLPVFSGWIQLTSGSEVVRVAYLGIASKLKDKQVVDNTNVTFGFAVPTLIDAAGNPQTAPTNYTFVGDDTPMFLWRQSFGTAVAVGDLVSPDIKVKTTFSKRGFSGWFPHHGSNGGSFNQVKTLGTIFEFDRIPRNDDSGDPVNNNPWYTFNMNTQFANGSTIPSGQYRLLFRSLKVTGDSTNENDYESWLSPVFGVTPP